MTKRIIQMKSTSSHSFKLPMSQEQAFNYILAQMMAEVKLRHLDFDIDQSQLDAIEKMSRVLTDDTASTFGFLLCGSPGTGKSTLMRSMQQLLNSVHVTNPYPSPKEYDGNYHLYIISSYDIIRMYKDNYNEWLGLAKATLLGIDDLGQEPKEVLDYGNVISPVVELLLKRYESRSFTMVTTNLSPSEIKEHYGGRIADRFNEMMEMLVLNNESYRKASTSVKRSAL